MKLKERINYLFSEEIWEDLSFGTFTLFFVYFPLIGFLMLMLTIFVERKISFSCVRLVIALPIIAIVSGFLLSNTKDRGD